MTKQSILKKKNWTGLVIAVLIAAYFAIDYYSVNETDLPPGWSIIYNGEIYKWKTDREYECLQSYRTKVGAIHGAIAQYKHNSDRAKKNSSEFTTILKNEG